MTNEFKKISQGDVTRYVLENASGGGMSAANVASMPMSVGGTRRRGDNLIAQEADKNTVPASTPRNFVAKNAKSSGAGAHKDKSKTIPRKEKHKKPYMEDHSTATGGWGQGSYDTYTAGNHGRGVAEDEEYDDEAGMADNNIETMKRAVDGLDSLIHKGDNLPEWCQEKIAVAKSMLVTVWDYMASEEQGVAEAGDTAKGQKMLAKVHQRAADRVTSKQADKDPAYARKAQQTQDRAWDRLAVKEQGVAEGGYQDDSKEREENLRYSRSRNPVADAIRKKLNPNQKPEKEQGVAEEWSQKYKSSINCSHPKGFSQKAHCAGKKKHNESVEMEMVCPDCGMCQTHGNNMMEIEQRLDAKCWTGKHKEGTKIKGGVRVNNCVPNESVDPYFESLQQMVERQLEPTMDLDTWVDNFQNADPNKYHQFKNKTPEKKK